MMSTRVLLTCAAIAATAIGLASPAAAFPADGSYTATVTDVSAAGHGFGDQLS